MYVFLNWFCCLLTSLLLTIVILRYRFLLIKPSIIMIAFFHLQIQWAATIKAGFIEQYLPSHYDFLLLAQVFPLLGLAVSFFIFHRRTVKVYSRIITTGVENLEFKTRNLVILLGAMALVLMVYLSMVPLSSTGIYAILLDPLESKLARETSLKLLDSALLKYGFSYMKSALAPLLCVLTMIFLIRNLKQKKPGRSALGAIIILFAMAAVSLPGARMPAAMLILTMLFALYLAYNMPLNPTYPIIAFLMIISLPVLMTLFREGQGFDLAGFFGQLQGGIFKRVFVVPMETGLWHAHLAQTTGFTGITAIPKLAELMAVDPINLSNIIYLKYSPYHLASGLANTGFVFAYYSIFGIGSLAFSLLGTWALDLAIPLMDKLKNNALLLATCASLAIAGTKFVATMFTTVLITNGFLLILVTAFILDRLSNYSIVSPARKGLENNNEE
ncbi:MAG: hypothetical protein GY940_09165 [bacterium]|nr:hypothetical protein [bacterium]